MSNTFTAATWNVYHSTPTDKLRPILRAQRKKGVSLFLMQEMASASNRQLLEDEGLEYFWHPRQYVVAWDPKVWKSINARGKRLSNRAYHSHKGPDTQYSEAAIVRLRHIPSKTSVLTMSYHTPSGVQVVEDRSWKRYQALVESIATMATVARRTTADAVLFGGDDNVDETRSGGPWDFMLQKATGLQQIQAPAGTINAGSRKIDDFRIKNLEPVGTGWTFEGGGDHNGYAQEFRLLVR